MDTLGGMVRTGIKVAGPASDLVELEDPKGLKHSCITFHRRFRDHPSLGADLVPVLPFLEHPDVCDLLELVDRVPDAGAFIYPTGTVFALADAFEVLNSLGETGGVKAGLELCFFVAQILQDAYVKAEPHGLYNHGDLSSWRVVLKPDGQVRVIGFGLPQIDMLMAHESDRVTPKESSYRYCPPERIDGEEEDFSSDLYSLALMAFELMVGEPLFNGALSEIKQQASNAQGPYRLYQYRERLPEVVIELFSRCLKFDIDARHADINEFIWEVRDLLALPEIDGPTLADVAARVHGRLKRRRASTTAADVDEGGPLLKKASQAPEASAEAEAEQAQRWGRVSRSGGRDPRRSAAPPEASPRDSLRDRLKRSAGRSAEPAAEDPKAALKDRLRRSRGRDDGPPSRSASQGSARELRRSGLRVSRDDRDSADGRRGKGNAEPKEPAPPDAGKAEDASSGLSTSGRAASLLKRLRSSKGSSTDTSQKSPSDEVTQGVASASSAAPRRVVSVRVDGREAVEVEVSGEEPVGEVVARALGRCGGVPTSLLGVAEAWPVIEQDGEPVGADEVVSELGEAPSLVVHLEPARLVRCQVKVDGQRDKTLSSMVSTAVTAGAALEQLATLLELSGGGWHLCAGDRRLHPLQPLGEVVRGSELSLVVRT